MSSSRLKVLTVVGNRPQFVKAAAVSGPLRRRHDEQLVHTGQHYDAQLSEVFFEELGLPRPDLQLSLGTGSNTAQTARMLAALEPVISESAPDVVLVYGDTNSTLAGALAAAQQDVPVAHVEAGMRSFDRRMPEEVNRVLTDHLAELLLCTSQVPVDNLRREGVAGRVELVGDVMVDVADMFREPARARVSVLEEIGVAPGEYVLATAHRKANVDDPVRLALLVDVLLSLSVDGPVVFPVHPRTRGRLEAAGLLSRLGGDGRVRLTEPLGYLEFTSLLLNARAVATDSGGVQKEAYLAGVPCVTLRDTTEWVETVETGWNALVDLDAEAARAALERPLPAQRPPVYGDGRAGERIADVLTLWRS
jgi:UDP-N-acetylglucosamine 2-epimerase (non-hydrolysing)/UDP-GlcNAc3NAcA epimerase